MQRIPPELKRNARELRNGSTDAERLLWLHLRSVRPRFTRQLVVSHYIIDIACRSARLAIEIDGSQHAERAGADAVRTAYLEAQGWRVLRFWNNEVLTNAEGVVRVLLEALADAGTHPRPLPCREGSAGWSVRIQRRI